jgi:hypothetical protein
MRTRALTLATVAGLAAAAAHHGDIVPSRPRADPYKPEFRWRRVKGSYSRTLAARLAMNRRRK